MSKVKCKTALMTPAAVNEIMECGELALKQALRGELTHDCHTMLVTQHSIAQAIEKHGEVHGLVDLLAPAQPSLQAIYERSYHTGTGKWTPTALRASELAALKDLLAAHRFQLGNSTAMSIKAINQRVWSRSEPSKSKQRAVTIAGFLDGLRSKYGSTALHIDQLIAA